MTSVKRELESPAHTDQTLTKKRKTGPSSSDANTNTDTANATTTTARGTADTAVPGIFNSQHPKNILSPIHATGDGDDSDNDKPRLDGDATTGPGAYTLRRVEIPLYLYPIDAGDAAMGATQSLDSALLTYLPSCRGLLMGWRDAHFTAPLARVLDDSPLVHVHVALQVALWRPGRGDVLRGRVTFMGPSHVGLLVMGTFNASVPVQRIPPSWSFNDDDDDDDADVGRDGDGRRDETEAGEGAGEGEGGYWRDHTGKRIALDQVLAFQTVDVKRGANILSVEGSLLHLAPPEPEPVSSRRRRLEQQVKRNNDENREEKASTGDGGGGGGASLRRRPRQDDADEQGTVDREKRDKGDKERRKAERKARKVKHDK